MASTKDTANYEIVWLVRRLFRAIADAADNYLQDDDLSTADRAVMEFLYPEKRLSVPAIASQYRVSRQHVQVTVNQLRSKGLVLTEVNPHHKRSPLISLSDLGCEAFTEIRRNEAAVINTLFAGLDQNDIDATRTTLRTLFERCESGELS